MYLYRKSLYLLLTNQECCKINEVIIVIIILLFSKSAAFLLFNSYLAVAALFRIHLTSVSYTKLLFSTRFDLYLIL